MRDVRLQRETVNKNHSIKYSLLSAFGFFVLARNTKSVRAGYKLIRKAKEESIFFSL